MSKEAKAVTAVVEMQKDLNTLTQDKVNEMAPQAVEVQPQVESLKAIALREGVPYIEPKRRLGAFGKLPEKLKSQHAHDWQYVKGICENYIVNGEPVKFWLSLYPGDPDCLWEIPVNRPVYVPRMVAKHLEEVMKYHKYGYVEKPETHQRVDDFQQQFMPTETHYRGKFRPIGAFS